MKKAELIHDSKGQLIFQIEYVETDDYLSARWFGFVNEISVSKQAFSLIIDYLNHYQCRALLHNSHTQVGPWPKLDTWLYETWIPELSLSNLRYFAHVHSKNAFTQSSARTILKSLAPRIQLQYFYYAPAAETWLVEKGHVKPLPRGMFNTVLYNFWSALPVIS